MLLAFAATVAAQAQGNYPNHPIRMVVAWPQGGGTDVIARIIAVTNAKSAGENRPRAT